MIGFKASTFTTQTGETRWMAERVGYVAATAWTFAELKQAISRENPDLDSRRIVITY